MGTNEWTGAEASHEYKSESSGISGIRAWGSVSNPSYYGLFQLKPDLTQSFGGIDRSLGYIR